MIVPPTSILRNIINYSAIANATGIPQNTGGAVLNIYRPTLENYFILTHSP